MKGAPSNKSPWQSRILIFIFTIIFLVSLQAHHVGASAKKLPERSLNEISENVNLLYPLVWQKTNDSASKALKTKPKLSIVVGPDSKIYSKSISKAFDLTMKVFNQNELPPTTLFLISSGQDQDWANKKFEEIMGIRFDRASIGYGHSPEGNAVQIKRVDPSNKTLLKDPNLASGATDAHGFTHLLQWYQLGFGDDNNHLGVPRWILEGSADFMQMFYMYQGNYSKWKSNRNARGLKQHSLKFLNDYLVYDFNKDIPGGESSWSISNRYPDQWAYEIGSYVCDVLVALKGPNSLIYIYRDYVETKDFNESFERIYGMPWSEAKPLIAKTLYKLARQ